MPRERKVKKADFKLKRRLSRPMGLAWRPHARYRIRAKQGTQEYAGQGCSRVALCHVAQPCYISSCAFNYLVVAAVRTILEFFLEALEKGDFYVLLL